MKMKSFFALHSERRFGLSVDSCPWIEGHGIAYRYPSIMLSWTTYSVSSPKHNGFDLVYPSGKSTALTHWVASHIPKHNPE